jgi:hypothetical protein
VHDRRVIRTALVLTLAVSLLAPARSADACAKAPPPGAEVDIAEEEALIVWDPATKTEQFIRRARFSSTAKSFGFLVPTPTVPKLDEVPDDVFYGLGQAISPEVVNKTEGFTFEVGSLLFEMCSLTMKGDRMQSAAPPVRVIATAHVAGFDATTLEADDTSALASWLEQHGFASTPALTQWLDRYVKNKWKLTAFVVASDQSDSTRFEVATRAVRMTFQAERPFYPYREPTEEPAATAGDAPRTLRVFLVADQRYQAMVADQAWHARVLHSAPIEAHGELAKVLGSQRMATVFLDDVSPRLGIDELYFYPTSSTIDVRQRPIVNKQPRRLFIPVDLIVVVGIIGYAIVRRRRRR